MKDCTLCEHYSGTSFEKVLCNRLEKAEEWGMLLEYGEEGNVEIIPDSDLGLDCEFYCLKKGLDLNEELMDALTAMTVY